MLALLLVTLSAAPAFGQGFFLDQRHHVPIASSFDIREVSIDTRIRDQVAEVQVSQTFHNPGSIQIEAEYLFPVPEEGAIQNFVLLVDGQELPGKLLPKDEAKRIYEEIVRRRKDPALLEYMGRGLIRTRVFPIPPGADRKVTMRYTSLLPRDRNVVDFLYPLDTQKFTRKPIEKLSLRISIESKERLKSIYSPSHDVDIDRDGDHHASLSLTEHNTIPQNDFHLVYTLSEGAVGASVLSYRPSRGEDGYFLLLASPEIRDKARNPRHQPKTVIFVIDRSGSMSGKKIEQARDALKFVLDNLRDDDTFNIVAYDDRVESFKPELQRYDRETRKEALRFVENLYPGGSTNIDQALGTALEMIRDRDRPSYVLFLTDGLPTAGETKETAIAAHAREANREHARIFSFGVGYDVNARLLDRLSGTNSGTTVYVKPDEDIEAHVARFYSKLTSPVLAHIEITFDGTDVNRTYPRDLPDLFEGGQLLWVGRYRDSGRSRVEIRGKIGDDREQHQRRGRPGSTRRGPPQRLRRDPLGQPPRRRPHRPDRPPRPQLRTDQRAGRPQPQVRHPHPLHLVPRRGANPAPRPGRQRAPGPRRTRTALHGRRRQRSQPEALQEDVSGRRPRLGSGTIRRYRYPRRVVRPGDEAPK